jgi:hypothetical protein
VRGFCNNSSRSSDMKLGRLLLCCHSAATLRPTLVDLSAVRRWNPLVGGAIGWWHRDVSLPAEVGAWPIHHDVSVPKTLASEGLEPDDVLVLVLVLTLLRCSCRSRPSCPAQAGAPTRLLDVMLAR